MRKIIVGVTGGHGCRDLLRGPSLGILHALALLAFAWRSAVASDILDQPINLNIPPNTPLDKALTRWGTEVGMQVMMNSKDLAKEKTEGTHGVQPAVQALAALMRNSRFTYTIHENTIHVVYATLTAQAEKKPSGNSTKKTQAGADSTHDFGRQNNLAEVLVTAQKIAERLQDVPVPVTAVNANTLIENNQIRLQDYQAFLPGLNVTLNDYGAPELAIRGLTTGTYSNPTVATVVPG